ncbi:galactose mutarotase-like protein [Tothia fuscella]|uniref:Galactose mutarotase-like protein n=1 Tax=Tothia fuscella TaxID=1048955 RepID=A0A9P4NZ15_9PEZI|nr:galactose mutarotase-like protein [Tothia fuscella]
MAFPRLAFRNISALFTTVQQTQERCSSTIALLDATEDATYLTIANERLKFTVQKSTGVVDYLSLDKQGLLGSPLSETPTPGGSTGNGKSGVGPYLDCYCVPSGFHTPGARGAKYKLITGADSTGAKYGGAVMSEAFPTNGQVMEQYWFLKEGETGIHTFSRLMYPKNNTGPTRKVLQEFRTLFRPNSPLWTHLSTNEKLSSHLPKESSLKDGKVIQDAAYDIGGVKNEPYVTEMGPYFTKYTFADVWQDHVVHGMYGDGSGTPDGTTFGAWMIMNTRDTYYGGPLHSDLTVDGIVYNYMVSNHHGATVPNITAGFDRTFGPSVYYFNHGSKNSSLAELRADALKLANPTWNTEFYNAIAKHVSNYIPPATRATFRAKVTLPSQAKNAIAILSVSGVDVQDNAIDHKAFQYWESIKSDGAVEIPMVVPGTYRLTIYADSVFGEFFQDNIEIKPVSNQSPPVAVTWKEQSSGTEVWRLGTPDHSSGEFKHGAALDTNHTSKPEEYRIVWLAYEFIKEFPGGVRYRVGKSSPQQDWNYIHWSEFNGVGGENVSDWHIYWNHSKNNTVGSKATLTVQLAGVKTASGNVHVIEDASKQWPDLPFTVLVNGKEVEVWKIPYWESSSCAIRSGIICYNTAHKFVFDTALLKNGENEIVLRIPSKGKSVETANLPGQFYVQYDALRLEVGN